MDFMEIDDSVFAKENLIADGHDDQVTFQKWKKKKRKSLRCATLGLGLLCAVLLAGNIGQIIHYELIIRPTPGDPTLANHDGLPRERERLQNDNDNLTAEGESPRRSDCGALTAARRQLEARLSDLTADRDRLRAGYDSLARDGEKLLARSAALAAEKDELRANFSRLKAERARLQAGYGALERRGDAMRGDLERLRAEQAAASRLQSDRAALQGEKDALQSRLSALTANRDHLLGNYSALERDHGQLRATYDSLVEEREQLLAAKTTLTAEREALEADLDGLKSHRDLLQSNFSSMRRAKEQLEGNYSKLSLREHFSQISYRSLWREKAQLQARYGALRRDNEQLRVNHSRLAAEAGRLRRLADKMMVKLKVKTMDLRCPAGWRKFGIGCYFVSSVKRNWNESRRDCLERGADLVVVDGQDEQAFVGGLLQPDQNAWIGLSDSAGEGAWAWVDGTPVTTEFWLPGQPNDLNGDQDCGEITRGPAGGGGGWNDDGCFAKQLWICEGM